MVHVRPHDIVAIARNPEPDEGALVVARIEDTITVKQFHRRDDGVIELEPQSTNPEHKPIEIDGETQDWEIVGVAVGAMIGAPSIEV